VKHFPLKGKIMGTSNVNSVVLVVGATGNLGAEICRQLRVDEWDVKGLVRNTSNSSVLDRLHEMGVSTVIGDLKDAGSLNQAMAGVDYVISTVSSTASRQGGDTIDSVDLQGQKQVVDAARKAGVRHFVYVSVIEIDQEFPLQTAKRQVEQHLVQSGIPFTILRPAMFMEVWLSPHLGFDYLHSKATIFGEGVNPISWIAIKDVAAFAVASLSNSKALNAKLSIGGPEALSPLEVVKIFEHHFGTTFALEHVPVEALLARRKEAADSLEQTFASLQLAYSAGCEVDMDTILRDFRMKLTSIGDYASGFRPVKSAVL
jgi:uncharacterized protein YbjT (DUF2867 family)